MKTLHTAETPVIRIATDEPPDSGFEREHEEVISVGSTGLPAIEPLVMVTERGTTALYTGCSPDRIREIVERTVAENTLADESAADGDETPDAVVEHDPATTRLPEAPIAGLDTGVRQVLGGCGWRRPTDPADHEAAGGFGEYATESVLDVADTLCGRGWGDLCHDDPVGETWETVRETDGDPAVVVNGHGSAADTLLLASTPFDVLAGAVAAAETVGARGVIVYLSAADTNAIETVRTAAERYPDSAVAIDVVTGPDEYRAAEPTMALEAIEGNHRLEARLRPPGPETVGLHGRPTLIHTPRTLAQLSVALRAGDNRGEKNRRRERTRLTTVDGDVETTATVELPETASLSSALDAVALTNGLGAARVGGQFGGITADLDVAVDPESLAARDLGTEGAVHVLGDDRCVVEFVGRTAAFAAEENCGRCVPCREGTTQLVELLRAVYDGQYDAHKIEELVRVMSTSSICAFGVHAGRPVRTAMGEFEDAFESHANGRCPAEGRLDPLEAD